MKVWDLIRRCTIFVCIRRSSGPTTLLVCVVTCIVDSVLSLVYSKLKSEEKLQ